VLLADADLVSISEKDGVQEFSATFDLTKQRTPTDKKRSPEGECPKTRVVV